eukprot:1334985-Rhodomonas_salina.3
MSGTNIGYAAIRRPWIGKAEVRVEWQFAPAEVSSYAPTMPCPVPAYAMLLCSCKALASTQGNAAHYYGVSRMDIGYASTRSMLDAVRCCQEAKQAEEEEEEEEEDAAASSVHGIVSMNQREIKRKQPPFQYSLYREWDFFSLISHCVLCQYWASRSIAYDMAVGGFRL